VEPKTYNKLKYQGTTVEIFELIVGATVEYFVFNPVCHEFIL
jgi:hypothetical protein